MTGTCFGSVELHAATAVSTAASMKYRMRCRIARPFPFRMRPRGTRRVARRRGRQSRGSSPEQMMLRCGAD